MRGELITMNIINEENADLLTLLDCGGTLFINNPNPKEVYANIMKLYGGKDIDLMAKYFNLEDELEQIRNSELYKSKPSKVAPYVAGELMIDVLLERGEINKETLINARIDAVRKREDKLISSLIGEYPSINFAIATQDGQMIHKVLDHYFPELEKKYQVVTTDSDINALKTSPEFYYNAEKRLHIPTSNMALVDDAKSNIQGIENAGGLGTLFDPNDQHQTLEDTVKETIEQMKRR